MTENRVTKPIADPSPSTSSRAAKYRTIVADPPWQIQRLGALSWREGRPSGDGLALDYPTMSVDRIAALPVADLAENDAHLYVWTTQRYLEQTFGITRAWGFEPSTTLVWCKRPYGWMPGGAFFPTVEFVVFAKRGTLKAMSRIDRQWWEWGRGAHSAKPEAFLDIVEQVSPPPRLELFARRQRLGWDTWGDQALKHVEVSA